jgi:putative membrane protein
MKINFSKNIKLYFKGMAMGVADAFPGISGGTMALILGIYKELISSISNINLSLFKTLKRNGLNEFWKEFNGTFLIILFSGILSSLVVFMNLASFLIDNFPILIWSFFLGLVSASIYIILKPTDLFDFNKKSKHIIKNWILLFSSIYISYLLTSLSELNSLNENVTFIFFAGFIASCAMILPGISGSYILVILGLYKTMSKALINLELNKILIFGFGVILGLASFSKVVKWGFDRFPNKILIVMTGLIIGSIHKLWPWKLYEINILPTNYSEYNYLIESIVLFMIGFCLIFLLEKNNKNQNIEKT